MELQNYIIADLINTSRLSHKELYQAMFIIHKYNLVRQRVVDEFVWSVGGDREEHAKYFDLTAGKLKSLNPVIRRVLERHGYTRITPENTSARFGRLNPLACIRAGNMRLFKFLESTRAIDRSRCMAAAAEQGNIEFMIYLAANNYPVDQDVLFRAIEGDHLACFKYALTLGCDLDDDACEHIITNQAIRCFRHAVQAYVFVLPEDAYFEYFSHYNEEMTLTMHNLGIINSSLLADAAIDADHTVGLRFLISVGVHINPASIENARSLRCLQILHEEAKIPVTPELALVYAEPDCSDENHRKRQERFQMIQYLADKVNLHHAYCAAIDIGSADILAAILEVHPQPAISLCDDIWHVAAGTNSLDKYKPMINLACDYIEAEWPDILLTITPALMFLVIYCERKNLIDRAKHLLTPKMREDILDLAIKHKVWRALEFVTESS